MRKFQAFLSALMIVAAIVIGIPTAASAGSGVECSDQVERNGWSFTVYPGADDTAALQCALDLASQLGSMPTINLAEGEFTIGFVDGAPDQSVRIRGAGAYATTIVPAANLDCVARFDEIGTVPLMQFIRGSVELINFSVHVNDVSCAEPWLDGPFFDWENITRQDLEAVVSMRPETRLDCVPGEVDDARGKLLVRGTHMSALPTNYGGNFPFADWTSAQYGVVYGQPGQFGNQSFEEDRCISDLLAGGYKVVNSSFNGFPTAVEAVGINGPVEISNNRMTANDEGVFLDAIDGGKIKVRRNAISEGGLGVFVGQGPPPFEFERTQVFIEDNKVNVAFDGIVVAAPTFFGEGEVTPSQNAHIRYNDVTVAEGVGIVADGQMGVIIAKNKISGSGVFGMVLVTTDSVARDNDMSGFEPFETHVLLPPPASGNAVRLAEGETVIDEGTDNVITFS